MMLFTMGFVLGAAAVTIVAVIALTKLSARFDQVEAHLQARSALLDQAVDEIKRKEIETQLLRSALRQTEAVRSVTSALDGIR